MSSEYPVGRGLFDWPRMANHEQPFHLEENRSLGHPNAVHNNNRPIIRHPARYATTRQNDFFNGAVANDDRRRRSSAVSPRSMQPSGYHTPFFRPFNTQIVTPPSSNNFTDHTTQAQIAVEPNFHPLNRATLSTISGTTTASTTSASAATLTASHNHNQHAIFTLLSDICTEALRRKWQDEIQRQSIRSLVSRRPRSSQHGRRSRSRRSPYAPLSELPNPHSRASQRTQRPSTTTTPATEPPLRFMDLMQRVATAMWENATHPQAAPPTELEQSPATTNNYNNNNHARFLASMLTNATATPPPSTSSSNSASSTRGAPETAAIESMRTLYSLGNSVVAAADAAARGESFNVDEMRDVVGVAAGFCRVLGYAEGAERCEVVGRRPLGGERMSWGEGEEGGVV